MVVNGVNQKSVRVICPLKLIYTTVQITVSCHHRLLWYYSNIKTSNSYMPTFPIYAGFSRFEVVKKANPDIPIGIAKIH
jgi:hypothetical protein